MLNKENTWIEADWQSEAKTSQKQHIILWSIKNVKPGDKQIDTYQSETGYKAISKALRPQGTMVRDIIH